MPKVVECLDEGVDEVGKWRVVKERVGRGEELGGGEGCVWRECGGGETLEARDKSEPLHSIMEAVVREEENVFFTHIHIYTHTLSLYCICTLYKCTHGTYMYMYM